MSTNSQLNQAPYLREQRQYPFTDLKALASQSDQAYIDIASKVNARIIGTFAVNSQMVTGEQWFIQGQPRKQQSLRQVYVFNSTANPIPHNINLNQIDRFTRCFGEYTDGTNWYGLINGTNVAIAGQISFYVDPNNIQFLVDAGAPALTKGNIVLEWLSQTDTNS